MMRVASLSRRAFLDSIQRGVETNSYSLDALQDIDSREAQEEELSCLWGGTESKQILLPTTIVVNTSDTRDFLAWCVTYLEPYLPVTSLCRIIDRDIIVGSQVYFGSPDLSGVEGACVGAVLGETWSLYASSGRSGEPSLLSCFSTFSFASGRALALNYSGDIRKELEGRWGRALSVTGQGPRHLAPSDLWLPASILRSMKGGSDEKAKQSEKLILRACKKIADGGDPNPIVAKIVGREFRDVFGEAVGTREDRVLRLQKFGEKASLVPGPRREALSFALGYLANQIAPGTLKHLGLLRPFCVDFITCAIWCGICAGLGSKTQLLSSNNGLGWRLLRDLLVQDELTERPRVDIALEELELLRDQDFQIRSLAPSAMHVEIGPLIGATFGRRRIEAEASPRQQGLFDTVPTQVGDLIAELQTSLSTMERRLREISREVDTTNVRSAKPGRRNN